MNKLDESKTNVIDSSGKLWKLDVPHPMPLPDEEFMKANSDMLQFYDGVAKQWSWCARRTKPMSTHWIMRAQPPEPPSPKTQEEMDEEEFVRMAWTFNQEGYSSRQIWHAGVAHGRKQP